MMNAVLPFRFLPMIILEVRGGLMPLLAYFFLARH
jgi:hypothetical protein